MRNAITLLRKQGKEQRSRLFAPLNALMMAEVEAGAGRTDAAMSIADETLGRVDRSGQHWFDAEVHRIRGEFLLKHQSDDSTAAEAAFMRAMEVAHSQQARTFELRAATSMARLWRDRGKRREARELLAPVYGWFTEGFDMRDLKEAKALLDTLPA
jgi:predicted ATPase